ncbi:MAG: tape measure protein, partial [candidate division SR1 bacterium]|nr:tape measure protein [candidate division SR1 bacterium]
MKPLVWKVMLDDTDFVKKIKEAQEFARDTGKKLNTKYLLELEFNKVQADNKVQELRNMLKSKDLDTARRVILEIDLNRAKKQASEAGRLLNNYLNTGDAATSRLSAKFGALGEKALSVSKAIGLWVGSAIGNRIVDLGKRVIQLADNYEQAKISFTTMLGSADKAESLLSKLSSFAKQTPFELTDVRENAKQLLAMGISADHIIPTMKALGDVSAGLGVPMERLALNYGQVITKGKLAGQELKDFTTAGVPLLDELSKNLGKSKTEIQDMISKGQISADMVTEAFKTMTSEGGRFADLMAKQSGTLSGMRSNFSDTLAGIGEKIGLFLLPGLKESVDWISKLFSKPENAMEEEIERLDGSLRESQKVLNGAREELNKLNNDLRNGKISATDYNAEFDRLTGIISVVEQDIAKTNAKIKEQNNLLDIATDIAQEHTETLQGLEGQQNAVGAQVQQLEEKYRQGLITEEEYLEQKKALWQEYGNLEQAIKEENEAHKKENDLYRMLQEGGMKAANIKATLANLRINNGDDINALNSEQQAANATAMSYIAMAKSKAQAAVLEVKTKLGNQQKSDSSFWGYLKRGGTFSDGVYAETPMQKTLKNELKIQEEYLAGIEKMEQEQNAFFSKPRQSKSGSSGSNNPSGNGGNGVKGSGGGGKSNLVTQKKEELKKLRDLQIQEIQQSDKSEKEKYKNILEINEDYKKKLVDLEGRSGDQLVKKAQESAKEEEEVVKKKYSEINKAFDKSGQYLEKYGKQLEDLKKKWTDTLDGVKNELRGLNHEMKELDQNYYADMAERFVQVQEELKKDSLEAEERNKLQEELTFLMEKTTEEQRKQAEESAKLSQSQKRELDYQKQKAALQEKINIAKSFSSQQNFKERKLEIGENEDGSLKASYIDEKGEMQEVTDYKNIQYLADLANKQKAMSEELKLLAKNIVKQTEIHQKLTDAKTELEQNYTKILEKEIEERKKKETDYVDHYERESRRHATLAQEHAQSLKAAAASIAASRAIIEGGRGSTTNITNHAGNTVNQTYNINNPSDASAAVFR